MYVVPFLLLPCFGVTTSHVVFALRGAQVEVWLTQEVLAKHKRVGGISTRYYAARTNGPPSSVSEEKVGVFAAT